MAEIEAILVCHFQFLNVRGYYYARYFFIFFKYPSRQNKSIQLSIQN